MQQDYTVRYGQEAQQCLDNVGVEDVRRARKSRRTSDLNLVTELHGEVRSESTKVLLIAQTGRRGVLGHQRSGTRAGPSDRPDADRQVDIVAHPLSAEIVQLEERNV